MESPTHLEIILSISSSLILLSFTGSNSFLVNKFARKELLPVKMNRINDDEMERIISRTSCPSARSYSRLRLGAI